ncbi:hypothetical protein ACQVQY_11890 [Bacillus mycoides]|uniref:hypothetical protein n=1 Tax=Bacillus mycoides TaxID=1405 RepID=UPI003D65E0A5
MENTQNKKHELVMHIQLKSGRSVMLYEDVTEHVEEGMTQEILFDEIRKGELESEVVGRSASGNIITVPNHAVDYIEMNIQERTKETV